MLCLSCNYNPTIYQLITCNHYNIVWCLIGQITIWCALGHCIAPAKSWPQTALVVIEWITSQRHNRTLYTWCKMRKLSQLSSLRGWHLSCKFSKSSEEKWFKTTANLFLIVIYGSSAHNRHQGRAWYIKRNGKLFILVNNVQIYIITKYRFTFHCTRNLSAFASVCEFVCFASIDFLFVVHSPTRTICVRCACDSHVCTIADVNYTQ